MDCSRRWRLLAAACAALTASCSSAPTARTGPTADPSGSTATAERSPGSLVRPKLSTAGDHTCGLRRDGQVLCWGANGEGELGDGTTNDSASPVAVAQLPRAVDVSAGGIHTCAVDGAGTVWCWGSNTTGELGDGTTSASDVPVAVVGLPARATGVAAAEGATCAALADGTVWCWGDGAGGPVNPSLGNGTNGSSTVPVQALGIGDAVAIAGSWYHFCARRATGAVACWGGNGAGELGDGTTIDRDAPVAVVGLADAVDVSAGLNHTCAVRRGGEVVCWGNNQFGQLGDGTQVGSTVPEAASLLPPAFAIAAGNEDTCAALLDGTTRCVGWAGANGGQLGNGSAQSFSTAPVTPTLTVDVPPFPPFDVPLFGVDSIATNGYEGTSCAATLFGEAFCWGDDAEGEVGTGSTQPAPVLRPTRVNASF